MTGMETPEERRARWDRDYERAVKFAHDATDALRAVGAQDAVEYLDGILRDGQFLDIDGCVAFLGKYDLVTQEWVDRLTELNYKHDYDEELEELTGYLTEQTS